MASVRYQLSTYELKKRKDGTYPLSFIIIHIGKREYLPLGKSCLLDYWDNFIQIFTSEYLESSTESEVLLSLEKKAIDIIQDFDRDGIPFDFDLIKNKFLDPEETSIIKNYFKFISSQLKTSNLIGLLNNL